jgi:hypothetical protein
LQNHTGNRSGTNLAKRFKKNQQDYTGLEYSQSMIAIRKEMKTALSSWGMRDFNLEKQVDAIIITGRSTSYLTTNDDLNETFASL